MPNLLFNSGRLPDALDNQNRQMVHEIESVPEDHVVAADEIEWAKALGERYAVEAPVLQPDRVWMDAPVPTRFDVSWDTRRVPPPAGGPMVVPGHRTMVHVPFTGDATVFNLQPSEFTLNPPAGDVAAGEVRFGVEYPDDNLPDIKALTDSVVAAVHRHLEFANKDLAEFNERLVNIAQTAIRARRQRIERHREHVQTSGMRIGPPRDDAKTYIADVIVRRPSPTLPARMEQPLDLEPVLRDDIYSHILFVIRQHVVSIEQAPATYATMPEEDLRHVILAALNTHYAGAGSAEAFNFGGKTDIRVTHDGRNLFIAECKWWTGPKGFTDTLDQLFRYQAWRDVKLAIIMFVRNRGFTEVIESGHEALRAHAQFVRQDKAAGETELRAVVNWKGDERRHADLNIFFISLPTP